MCLEKIPSTFHLTGFNDIRVWTCNNRRVHERAGQRQKRTSLCSLDDRPVTVLPSSECDCHFEIEEIFIYLIKIR